MNRQRYKWLQLLWWPVLYAFWILVFRNSTFTLSHTITVEFCYLIFVIANFYFNTVFTIPVLLYRKRYVVFTACLLAGICVTALLRVPVAMFLNKHYFLVNRPQPGFTTLLSASLLNIFIWTICLVAGKLIADRFHFQQYIARVEQEKAKAELDFLNAQFNPHFLFNSINSIYGHIDKHNHTARNMLLNFSEMLRYQLYDCNTDSISIEKEINYLQHYIKLQQSRKEESLVVQLYFDENVKGISIAPLLFIAFIENAFKYVGNDDKKENKVQVSLACTGNELVFTCFNTKEPNNQPTISHKGIGIANAKRRMELLYPASHNLLITDNDHYYEVNIKLLVS